MSFHVFSTVRYSLLACCALHLVRFPGKPDVFRFFFNWSGCSFYCEDYVHFQTMINFILQNIQLQTLNECYSRRSPPQKETAKKRGCATFPANFLKLLVKAVSSHLAVILFGQTKISLICRLIFNFHKIQKFECLNSDLFFCCML